jgi:hypothetical protein
MRTIWNCWLWRRNAGLKRGALQIEATEAYAGVAESVGEVEELRDARPDDWEVCNGESGEGDWEAEWRLRKLLTNQEIESESDLFFFCLAQILDVTVVGCFETSNTPSHR